MNTASLRWLHTLYRVGVVGDLTDGQLLERFLAGRDESAEAGFAELVDRHGPMVLRVCRQILEGLTTEAAARRLACAGHDHVATVARAGTAAASDSPAEGWRRPSVS